MSNYTACFIFRDMGTGGAQKIEAFVANELVKNGFDVVAINMSSGPISVDISPSIRIKNVIYDPSLSSNKLIFKFLYKVKYLINLRKNIKLLNPDIVCAFLSDVVRITVMALLFTGIPIIGSERGDPTINSKGQFNKYKRAYKNCAGVVFQLPYVKDLYKLDNAIQEVIPNPCIPRQSSTIINPTFNDKLVISAGRLVDQKRFDLLIKSFCKCHQTHEDYKLYIYGDGPLKTELQSLIVSLNASDYIVLCGDVANVFLEAADAQIFALSSDFEGIPNVLLEAMALGFPCVSTDCSPGGAKYLIGESNGLIVPRNDIDALSNAINLLIENPELRSSCGINAKEFALSFSPSSISNQWISLFYDVLRRF